MRLLCSCQRPLREDETFDILWEISSPGECVRALANPRREEEGNTGKSASTLETSERREKTPEILGRIRTGGRTTRGEGRSRGRGTPHLDRWRFGLV